MTQAAVSYQIRVLEDRVGMPLFFREPRQVTLTSTGKRLSPRVTEALELLGAAFADLTHTSKFSLTLAVLPTIASERHWGRFRYR